MKRASLLLSVCLLLTLSTAAQTNHPGSGDKTERPVDGLEKPRPDFDLNEYLSSNLNYPDSARKKGIEGRVVVKFVVNKAGGIEKCEIVKGIGGGCDEEAIRVVKKMPAWIPGKKDGKPVSVYFTLPISFKLQ